MIKKFLLASVLLSLCLNAHAVTSMPVISANTSLDWDSFSWKTIDYFETGVQPNVQWIEGSKKDSTNIQNNGVGSGWGSNNSSITANVKTFANELGASISVLQDRYELKPDIRLSANRYGEFQISGSGLVVFEVGYNKNIEFDDNISTFDYGNSIHTKAFMSVSNPPNAEGNYGFQQGNTFSLSADLYFDFSSYLWDDGYSQNISWNVDGNNKSYQKTYNNLNGTLYEDGYYPEYDDLNQTGKFIIPMFFNDGDTGSISAGIETYVNATVNPIHTPIPGSIFLLASGLIGIVGLKRNRSKK